MSQEEEHTYVHLEPEQFDDGLETNIVSIAKTVFSQPVGRPFSIGLQLDHDPQSGEDHERLINEMLTLFLLAGVETKHGEDVSFETITKDQMHELRQYMWSVGYDVTLHTDDAGFWFEFTPYSVATQLQ